MNVLNKVLTLIAAGSMLTAQAELPGCTPASGQPTLTIGIDISAGLIPYSSFATNGIGMPQGADIDFACQLAQRLEAQSIKFVNIPYNQFPTALKNGTVQLAIGVSAQTRAVNPPATVSFVVYNNDNLGLIVTPASLAALQALNPEVPLTPANVVMFFLVESTVPTGVIGLTPMGDTPPNRREASILDDNGVNEALVMGFANLADAIAALNAGSLAAIFVNNATANAAVAAAPGTLIALNNVAVDTMTAPNFSAGLSIAIAPSCCQLYANVAAAVAAMVADGTLAAINTKWNTDGTPSPLPQLIPMACVGVAPAFPQRNTLGQSIFNKFCVTTPGTLCAKATVTTP